MTQFGVPRTRLPVTLFKYDIVHSLDSIATPLLTSLSLSLSLSLWISFSPLQFSVVSLQGSVFMVTYEPETDKYVVENLTARYQVPRAIAPLVTSQALPTRFYLVDANHDINEVNYQ